MSIVRVGLAETKGFADGYDAIFGKKDTKEEKKPEAQTPPEADKQEAPPQPQAEKK